MTGLSVASFLVPVTGLSQRLKDFSLVGGNGSKTRVAATEADNYERAYIRQKVEHLFDSLGGISDVVKPGDKVGIMPASIVEEAAARGVRVLITVDHGITAHAEVALARDRGLYVLI